MSDFLAPSSYATPASDFDVTQIDSTLQAMSAVERSWRSPNLPKAVKLDLASIPGVTPESAVAFLRGIDSDLSGDSDETPDAPEQEPPPVRYTARDPGFERDGYGEARVIAAGVTNQKAPTDPTVDAVKRFKEEAIRRGLMEAPPGGRVDSTWAPEMNSIRYEMAFDDHNERRGGDRTGAAPVSSVMEQLEKWTSPAGLLAAATELDLWWDFGALNRERSSWGDKFRAINDAKNPFDFGAKLIDAVTGPLDDAIMPIVNWALVGSGVGSLTVGAKGALLFGGRGGKLVQGLYRTMNTTSAANVAALGERSWTATRLMKSEKWLTNAAGTGMKAYRGSKPVVAGKAVVQTGMRLGFTSQAQDMLPGYQGGLSLADVPAIGAQADRLKEVGRNPIFMPAEILIAPYNIFAPGTFFRHAGVGQGLVSQTASGLFKVGGTIPGRAAFGAVAGAGIGSAMSDDNEGIVKGAVMGAMAGAGAPLIGKGLSPAGKFRIGKMIGGVGDFLQHTNYKPLAQHQGVVNAIHRGMETALDGDELAAYQKTFGQDGFRAAFAKHNNLTDEDQIDAAISFVAVSASIDATAASLAGGRGAGFQGKYHTYRNKLIAQLRTFDVDAGDGSVNIQELAASIAMRFSASPEKFKKEYLKILGELRNPATPWKAAEYANQQNRVAAQTLRQLLSGDGVLTELDDIVGIQGKVAGIGTTDGLSVLEAYMPEVVPTLGKWNDFTNRTTEISALANRGTFDGSTFVPSINPMTGAPMKGATREIDITGQAMEDVDLGFLDALFRDGTSDADVMKILKSKNISVAAQSAPGGRITVARVGTVTKHQVREESKRMEFLIHTLDSLDALDAKNIDIVKLQAGSSVPLTDLEEDALKAVLRAGGVNVGDKTGAFDGKDSFGRVLNYARRKNISVDEVRRVAMEEAQAVSGRGDHWQKYGLDEFLKDADGKLVEDPRTAIKMRRKQLNQQEKFTAAEIDGPKLVDDLRNAGKTEEADELQVLIDGLAGDEYKLVYGVEFLTPNDLSKTGSFGDMSIRNAHATTLGNVFKGRLPIQGHTIEVRRQRLALQAAFADHAGIDEPIDSDLISNVLSDMRRILEEGHERSNAMIDHMHNQSIAQRMSTSVRSSATPMRLEDLSKSQGHIVEELVKFGYDEKIAQAAWLASNNFRNSSFKDLGLYAFEAKMRTRNQFVGALKFAGNGGGAAVGAAVVGYTGMQIANADLSGNPDQDFGEKLIFGLGGAALGALAGGGAGALAKHRMMDRAKMSQYGHLADTAVRARDALRFTLSPFFDISRYTEGQMLAQTAGPLRGADGARIAMPMDMSPTGVRRRIGKRLSDQRAKDGLGPMSKSERAREARREFDAVRTQFRQAAIGDFDPEVLDSTGKWFSQVGIAGFNPTDWMAGAFGELRAAGFAPEDAYRHVREMYTYGTNGRSAAELSVNFIFFPFSFQKKALGHIAKWMNDDLARSIMITDAYKTYEFLDKRYDLNDKWRDHVPMLEQLNRLNMFAFGISPGRAGGINAPFVEAGVKVVRSLFDPTGVSLKNSYEAAELTRVVRSLTPALNDINWMMMDAKEQLNVITGETHQTFEAEIRDGYEEFSAYRQDLSDWLEREGASWSDLQTKPWLAQQKMAYEMFRADLGAKYPAWLESRKDSVYNSVSLEIEKNDRLARAAAGDPQQGDEALYKMEQILAFEKQELSYGGVSVGGNEGWENASNRTFERVQAAGVAFRERDPYFKAIWDKFYRRDFGPLEAKI